MLGYPLTPPPPTRGARRLTARPAGPQGLGQPRGGGPPPLLQPPKRLHTPRGHALAGGSPRVPWRFHGGGVVYGMSVLPKTTLTDRHSLLPTLR